MINWFKDLIWALFHDADTEILLSILISCAAMILSIITIVLKLTGR